MNREELLKNAKPILFNTEMVQAILGDRKTVTRRVIKPQPIAGIRKSVFVPSGIEDGHGREIKLLYKVGDIFYVRETWSIHECVKCQAGIPALGGECKCKYVYRASYGATDFRWKPSIHMPKEAARIFLKVTDVRVERLQDITEEDAITEGMSKTLVDGVVFISAKGNFHVLWDSLNIKRGYSWEANPWVWVIEFERVM
jgi:hypothetical protein